MFRFRSPRRVRLEMVSRRPSAIAAGERIIPIADLPDKGLRKLAGQMAAPGRVVVIRRVRGETAWLVLGVAVTVYEICAAEGELLSEAVDRALVSHPWLTRIGVAVVALHLVNLLPNAVDPIHHVANIFRRTVDVVHHNKTADPPD